MHLICIEKAYISGVVCSLCGLVATRSMAFFISFFFTFLYPGVVLLLCLANSV